MYVSKDLSFLFLKIASILGCQKAGLLLATCICEKMKTNDP